jgi:ssDNA-binding Zn-finger/Zn-ribbon topoisomerase 1
MPTHLGNNDEYNKLPLCPQCGKKMTIRDSGYGKFIGCTGYPECKSRMSYDMWVDRQFDSQPVQLELDLEEYTPEEDEAELRRIMKEDKPYMGFEGWDTTG